MVVQNSACIIVRIRKIGRACWVEIPSIAGGADLLANVVSGEGLAATGDELVYGKGFCLGRSARLKGTW